MQTQIFDQIGTKADQISDQTDRNGKTRSIFHHSNRLRVFSRKIKLQVAESTPFIGPEGGYYKCSTL